MPRDGFKRKLAAIVSADARDYCRLMGEDEAGTVRTIHRREDLLHPPGSIPGEGSGGNGVTP